MKAKLTHFPEMGGKREVALFCQRMLERLHQREKYGFLEMMDK